MKLLFDGRTMNGMTLPFFRFFLYLLHIDRQMSRFYSVFILFLTKYSRHMIGTISLSFLYHIAESITEYPFSSIEIPVITPKSASPESLHDVIAILISFAIFLFESGNLFRALEMFDIIDNFPVKECFAYERTNYLTEDINITRFTCL